MATGKRPDGDIFAIGAKEGEVLDFPSVPRGWGVTVDGQDADGNSVTDPTNGIPPMEWFNSLLQRTDQNIWWLLQNALPDWLTGTWPKGAVVVNGDIVWRAQKETATEPSSSNGDWLALFPLQNLDGRYVPQTRKINGHALGSDANVTAQDIFNGQVVDIGNAIDLNTLTTPGLYRQAANAQAASGKNYPEANAGSLEVYKHAGITQVYRVYNNSRQYARTLYSGTWSAWGKVYDTNNKPSAGDVAAIPLAGSTAVTGAIRSSSEFQSTSSIGFRLVHGNYGTFLYQDGANFYLMLTKSGDQYGTYNTLRPLIVNLASGAVTIGELNLSNWTHFDDRYYTQTAANGKFQPKGNYTPTGTAYTKAESDAHFGAGKTTTGSNSAYYTHGNGTVFMQAVRSIAVGNNATVTVTLPTSFPNGILGVGSSYYGSGGNNQASFYLCTPVGKNQVRIQTHNCNGTFSLNVTGY